MKNKNIISKKITLIVISIITVLSTIISIPMISKANNEAINNIVSEKITMQEDSKNNSLLRIYPERTEISGKTFYIKNMRTGQYLDVQGGVAGNGTNVWQYKYNGTASQRWYLRSFGDGTYSVYTPLGNDGTYRYTLDISNGSGENYANVQIWQINGSDAQKFSIGKTYNSTYVLFTKCSNYQKAVVVNGPTCDQGRNVDQYTFQGYPNEAWILEPANRDDNLGITYAKMNYDKYVPAYPDLTDFNGKTADCANFVSQCMLTSGIHYDGDWKIYRKNFDTNKPTTIAQLDNTWELC